MYIIIFSSFRNHQLIKVVRELTSVLDGVLLTNKGNACMHGYTIQSNTHSFKEGNSQIELPLKVTSSNMQDYYPTN